MKKPPWLGGTAYSGLIIQTPTEREVFGCLFTFSLSCELPIAVIAGWLQSQQLDRPVRGGEVNKRTAGPNRAVQVGLRDMPASDQSIEIRRDVGVRGMRPQVCIDIRRHAHADG